MDEWENRKEKKKSIFINVEITCGQKRQLLNDEFNLLPDDGGGKILFNSISIGWRNFYPFFFFETSNKCRWSESKSKKDWSKIWRDDKMNNNYAMLLNLMILWCFESERKKKICSQYCNAVDLMFFFFHFIRIESHVKHMLLLFFLLLFFCRFASFSFYYC